jgi:hypothetical protein
MNIRLPLLAAAFVLQIPFSSAPALADTTPPPDDGVDLFCASISQSIRDECGMKDPGTGEVVYNEAMAAAGRIRFDMWGWCTDLCTKGQPGKPYRTPCEIESVRLSNWDEFGNCDITCVCARRRNFGVRLPEPVRQ